MSKAGSEYVHSTVIFHKKCNFMFNQSAIPLQAYLLRLEKRKQRSHIKFSVQQISCGHLKVFQSII